MIEFIFIVLILAGLVLLFGAALRREADKISGRPERGTPVDSLED